MVDFDIIMSKCDIKAKKSISNFKTCYNKNTVLTHHYAKEE